MGEEETTMAAKKGGAGWRVKEGVNDMEALAERLKPLDGGMMRTIAHIEEEEEEEEEKEEEEEEEEEEGTGGGEGGSRWQGAGTDAVQDGRGGMRMRR
jgi:hypothetical protein